MYALKNIFLTLISPNEVFEQLRDKPTWLLPVIMLLAITIAHTIVIAPITKKLSIQQMEAMSDNMSPDQVNQTKELLDSPLLSTMSIIRALISTMLSLLIQVSILHTLLSLLGGNATLLMGMAVVSYAQVPILIQQTIQAVLEYMNHRMTPQGISAIFPDGSLASPLVALVRHTDVFVIWQTFLLALGFSVAYKISKEKSYMLSFGYWVLGISLAVGFATFGSLAGIIK